jgi:phytoene synthase
LKAPGFDWTREDYRRELKRSSFAPGAMLLNKAARLDLEVFYAFCRAVDDSADEFGQSEGRAYLAAWKKAVSGKPRPAAPLLVRDLYELCKRRRIPPRLLHELIAGAQSDLRHKVGFKTRRELMQYCHRVAGVVGQACLPIFGIELKAGAEYAEALGRAFQLINIIRDAEEDARRGRDYFATQDLRQLGSRQALVAAYAGLAGQELARADALSQGLPAKGLRPSRLMAALYGELLQVMLKDGLQVYEKRYRLSAAKKMWIVLKSLVS